MHHTLSHNQTIIEVKNISFSYDGFPVLEDINLAIHKGDYLGIIGPNGGGKSTLVKIILGLLTPQKGSVKLFGVEIKQFKDWSKLAYIPQRAARFEAAFPATVYEVVSMGRFGKKGLLHFLDSSDHQIIKKSLEQVDMLSKRNRLIGDLSGGEQQRVFIAKALASEPEILFLDEPTAGVDVKSQEEFYSLLEQLNQTMDLTLVLVSHDIDVITAEATELACINRHLIYHGSPKQFLHSDTLEKLYGKGMKMVEHHEYEKLKITNTK